MEHEDPHGAYNDGSSGPVAWEFWLACIVLCLLAFHCCAQQTTYQYTGAPLEGASFNIITGSIVLSAPLPADGTVVVVPVSYAFIGNVTGIPVNGTVPAGVMPSFSFTMASGVIVAWNIIAEGSQGFADITISVTNLGDSYEFRTFGDGDCQIYPAKCTDTISSNTLPGVWSVPLAAVATMQMQLKAYMNGYMDSVGTIQHQNKVLLQAWAQGFRW
jgi:hypothetical protein